MARWLRAVQKFGSPIFDVRKMLVGATLYPNYLRDWRRYINLPGAEPLEIVNGYPCIFDRTSTTDFDRHYIYLNAWAFRKILAAKPERHIDVGSQIAFVTLLSAVVPVEFIDIRPLEANLSGLEGRKGSILAIPFADRSIASISSLHVVEHIGLGRYGDELDPKGSVKAMKELARVVALGGSLYVGLPVGRPRVCFNAHRVHFPNDVVNILEREGLTLNLFSAVDDRGRFYPDVQTADFSNEEYACGMYHFVRKHP